MNKIKKISNWFGKNLLFLQTLLLLIIVPLYPKLPIVDIRNTWVSVRLEDFIVLFVVISWIALLINKKVSLKTPLTIPIFAFWIIGSIATLHGVLLIFPTLANIFPNVAFLNLIRHIEYMSLFFIAYSCIKERRQLPVIIAVLVVTLLGVIAYGFGQKFLDFPAYLTMNEEFAKGIPIKLSALSRVPSTFAGHYDLAAYLVLMIPIMVSLIFGVKNLAVKIIFSIVTILGFVLLFMTVSRVSFFVVFAAIGIVLFFQKKKIIFISVPIVGILAIILIVLQPSLLNRFKATVSEADVLVDANTGQALGNIKLVPKEYFRDKVVLQRRVKDQVELDAAIRGQNPELYSTSSAIFPYKLIPEQAPLINAANISTGENLTQGTGYINLYLSPVTSRLSSFFYEFPSNFTSSPSAHILVLHGKFIVKKAAAYDLSFTTRFQGEWPRALDAFKKNILIGSGYGSVSLAVDNNYLRILGEIGLLGFLSFFILFLCLGIYMRKIYPDIDSKIAKSFVLGFAAGIVGLSLNALLIDVFEASKIAFLLWIMIGVTFGLLSLYQKNEINLLSELNKIAASNYAVISYFLLLGLLLFSPAIDSYFVGDDFTWLRWIADCKIDCSPIDRIIGFFSNSDGFFYRPGTKIYFYLMYSLFWLNQVVFHLVSILLHLAVTSLIFFIAIRVLKNRFLSFITALLFLIMSGSTEAVFWISSTGYLFNAFFGLSAVLLFTIWDEKRRPYYLFLSFISITLALLFHELGVVYPILIGLFLLYQNFSISEVKNLIKRIDYLSIFIPVLGYLTIRLFANSHWFSGDYSYNLLKLPLNLAGNLIGYAMLTFLGPISLPLYEKLRDGFRDNIFLVILIIPIATGITYLLYRFIRRKLEVNEKKVIVFGILFFAVSLLPFLGLGNITSRYSYISSFGLILVFVLTAKKIYESLQSNGREIALGAVSLIVVVFALFHIIQVQQSYFEWLEAGRKAKSFFISFESSYGNHWSGKDVQFHFVNVPTKIGNAWVFPVGLADSVWFAFRNDSARIFIHNDLKAALQAAGYSLSKIVLQFNPDGTVKEIDRFRNIPLNLITP